MFRPSIGEIILILLVVLVVFGARRLPELGAALGRAIRNFQGSMKGEHPEEAGDHGEKKE